MKNFTVKKSVFFVFLILPFFCHAGEKTLQRVFFDATKYAVSGFYFNPEEKLLGDANLRACNFYGRTICEFYGEDNSFRSLSIAEKLYPDGLGEIASLFCAEDLQTFTEKTEGVDAQLFTGDWIDQAMILAFEKKNQNDSSDGKSILDILEGNDGRGIEASSEKAFQNPEASDEEKAKKVEYTYTDKNGFLRRFYYDGEGFTASLNDEEILLTRTYGKEIQRKYYDSLYRLKKIEKLNFSSGVKNTKLISEKTYAYDDDSLIPTVLIEDDSENKVKIEKRFNEKGLLVKLDQGHFEAVEAKKQSKNEKENDVKEEKYFHDKEETYAYDENDRILETEITIWHYKTSTLGRSITTSLKNKFVYNYTNEDLPPDYDFFENGILRLRKNYTLVNDYSERMYFDDGFSVEAFYVDGIKKREDIYLNDVKTRSRSFE